MKRENVPGIREALDRRPNTDGLVVKGVPFSCSRPTFTCDTIVTEAVSLLLGDAKEAVRKTGGCGIDKRGLVGRRDPIGQGDPIQQVGRSVDLITQSRN